MARHTDSLGGALAIYKVDDGQAWTYTDGATIRLGESLGEAAQRLFDERVASFQPARLVSVEVVYKGRRGKAGN